jgi:hypothetical protein
MVAVKQASTIQRLIERAGEMILIEKTRGQV